MIVIKYSVEMSKTGRGGKLYVVEVDRNAVKEKSKKQSYLQTNKQPCKRRLQFDDSDDSNNEISQSHTLSRTRPNPTKKKNDSDSEVEKNAAVKESLLKNEFRWAIFWQSEIMTTLRPTSEQWPITISFIGKMSFQEDCSLIWRWTTKATPVVFCVRDQKKASQLLSKIIKNNLMQK